MRVCVEYPRTESPWGAVLCVHTASQQIRQHEDEI